MYIITGAAGMIGSALLWDLNTRGIDDVLIVDDLGSSDQWKNLVKRQFIAYRHKDDFLAQLTNGTLLDTLQDDFGPKREVPRLKGIVHMGACSTTTEQDSGYLMRNNLDYTKTLATWALKEGVRFINASSAATYGDGDAGFDDDETALDQLRPLNAYGYSKHLFDVWAVKTGAMDNLASIKFFNVYGPNEYHKGDMRSLVNKAIPQIQETGTLRLFKSYRPEFADGGQQRDFVYVKDCARLLADLLIKAPQVNGLFNLGAGTARSWNDLARAIFAAMDLPLQVDYIDMPDILRGKYQYFTQAPMDKLTRALDTAGVRFAPTSLEDGVWDYVRTYLLAADPYL